MRAHLTSLATLLVIWSPNSTAAENWAQFRGPSSNGVCSHQKLPVEWDADHNVAWKVKLPGVGWSQPIAWGDKIFVTTAETDNQKKPKGEQAGPGGGASGWLRAMVGITTGGDPPDDTYQWKVLCLDASTGDVLWEQVAHEGKPRIPTHDSNSYASETPVTDGDHLIAYFGMTGLYCYDLSGKLQWSKDLGSFPMQYGWGTGGSPTLHGNSLFLQCDNEESSFLVALDKSTGDELWRVKRDERSNWFTPYVWENKQRVELVSAGGNKVRSYDPGSGELLWEMDSSGRNATTPVSDDNMIYIGSTDRLMGRSKQLAAIRAGASGDISSTQSDDSSEFIAWSIPRGAPPIASPLVYAGCLYAFEQHGGRVRCYDAQTGKLHYHERLPGAKGFTSSPWASDGKVYCLDEAGQTTVLEAGPELKVLNTNRLDEMFWSSAAVVGENLLLRGVDHLYCISD